MRRKDTIPTPWMHRWRRFRYSVLPMLGFLACVALTAWLWPQQGQLQNAVGEVEAVRIDVAAGNDGQLLPLPNGQWTLFDTTESGQLIARLDDRPAMATLDTLHAELARLRKEVDAERVRIALDDMDRQRTRFEESMRLAWQVARCRLDVLDRKTAIEGDRIDLQRRDQELEFLKPLFETTEVNNFAQKDRQLRRDEAAKRLKESEAALAEAERIWGEAVNDLEAHDNANTPEVLRTYSKTRENGSHDREISQTLQLLSPIQARIAEQESRIRAVQLTIDSLEIRAPFRGTICAIHCWPGESVQAGDPIVTLAANQGRYIVSYIRQQQRIRPTQGMPVTVRLRNPEARPMETVIQRVGPQVELVPPRQRRDPNILEWGQPVCILPPHSVALRPGELVDVTFPIQTSNSKIRSTN